MKRRPGANRRGDRLAVSAPVSGGGGGGGGIVTSNLILHLDAGDPASYSGSGLAWNDLVSAGSGSPNKFNFASTPFYNSDVGFLNFASNSATISSSLGVTPTKGAIEIWARWRSTSSAASAILLAHPGSNWLSLGYTNSTYGATNAFELNTGISAVMFENNGQFKYRDGEWHQFVAVIDGASNTMYVDGVPVPPDSGSVPQPLFRSGSSTSTSLMAFATTVLGDYGGGYSFDGDMGVVRVYDTTAALSHFSAADVAQNYAAQSARFATFQPDNISGLRLWLDPNDSNSVTLSGSTIVEVRDKALALPAASVVSSVGNEPALLTDGGVDWMHFNGGEFQILYKNSGVTGVTGLDLYGSSTNSWEVILVLRPDSASTNVATTYQNNGIFGDNGGYIGMYVKDPGAGNLDVMSYMWDSNDRSGTQSQAPSTKVILGHSKAAGTADWSQWVNGTQTVIRTSNNMGSTPGLHYFGRGFASSFYDGLIGEVCFFDRELTSSERTDLTNYLKNKWGIP